MKTNKLISKRISRAIMEYELIRENDKILLALSGGKDSLAMSCFLGRMAGRFPVPFSVEAVHVKAPWEKDDHSEKLQAICSEWGIAFNQLMLEEISGEPDCFSCSRKRRKVLLEYADRHHYNSLALGHHMEDCLETFLMNLVFNSRIDPLLPRRNYPEKEKLTLIRPLILLQETIISRWVEEESIPVLKCNCPWKKADSRRKQMRKELESLTGSSAEKKLNMFSAIIP